MVSYSDSINSAFEALKQKDYSKAIEVLEMFEQLNYNTQSEQCLQIKKGLVEAYTKTGQREKAIWICQQLANNPNSEIKDWGQQKLQEFNPTQIEPKEKSVNNLFKLKSLKEFKSYYEKNLLVELRKFEIGRLKAIKAITISSAIAATIAGFSLIGAGKSLIEIKNYNSRAEILSEETNSKHYSQEHNALNKYALLFCLSILIVDLIIWYAFACACIDVYRKDFKHTIIKKIIDFIDSQKNFTYSSHSLLEEIHYTRLACIHSQLFQELGETGYLYQADCVSGKYDRTDVYFSTIYLVTSDGHNENLESSIINASNYRRFEKLLNLASLIFNPIHLTFSSIILTLSKQNSKTNLSLDSGSDRIIDNERFQGFFFRANFYKSFSSQTIILPKSLEDNFNFFNSEQNQSIQLEDPEFNRFFTVYGDDQIESRYILSTSLMSRLVEFRKKAKQEIYVSFVESKIYLAIKCDRDVFEAKITENMLSFKPLKEYFEYLQLMLGLVEDLNLNQQIWKR